MSSSGEIPESDVPANGASWEADDSNVPSPAGPENDEAAPEPAEPRENEPEPSLPDKNVTDAAEPEIRGENPKENEVEAKPVEPAARRALVDAVVRLSFRTGPGGGRDGANENGKLQDDDETNLNGHVADGEVRRAPPKEVKSTLVRVSQGELLSETAKRILWENEDIPQSLQHCLEVELASVSCRNQSRKRPREREAPPPELSPIQMQIALQNLVDAYAKGYLAYNEALLRAPLFPKAYHTLVNSSVPHIFDTLLLIERELARPVQELVSARDTNLADLVRKYKRDSQALTGRRGRQAQEEADQLAARHYEEMETAQKAFSSALADLTSNQRRRYVSFIEQLYAEYVAAIGPERGSEAERDAIAELVKGDSECGRRMVLRAMEASNFGRSEGGLRDLGTSDEQAPDLLPTRTRTPQITVQMQSLEELEVSGVEEEENEATSRSEQGTFDPDDGASTASRSAVTRTPSPSPAAVMDRPASPLTPPSSLRAKGRSESGTLQSDETILKPVNLGDRMINYLVGELISMGFDLEMSQAALQMSGQRLDQAINLLLEHPRDIRQFIEAKTAHASPVAPPAPIPMTITKERPGTGLLQRLPNSPPRGGPHFLDKQAEPQPASRSASSSSLSRWRESLQRQRSTIIGGESQEGAPSRTVSQSTKMDTANAGPPSTSPPKPGQPDFSFARRSAASPVPSLSTDQKLPRSPSRGSDSDREPGTGNNALKRLGTLFSKVGQPSGKDKTETKASNREERDSREAPEPLKPERFFIWEPDISETFTVWQGTHARTMYNLRLAVLPADNWFRPPNVTEELPLRAQTAQELYGNNLSGVVVVVTRSEFISWRVAARLAPRTKPILGTGVLRSIFDAAQRTTEFHFDPLHEQFRAIESDLDLQDGSNPMDSVAEGDVFVTRHGNLPLVHTVFYLIMDEEHHPSALNEQGQTNAELTPRTPLVSGYRNLLRVASACDVNNLIIPLFLLPEPHLSVNQDWTLLLRRCDQVCRSTKAYMTEAARNAQGGSGSGGSAGASADKDTKTWTFVVPPFQGTQKDRKSKESWDQRFPPFRDRFADVFRA